MSDVKSKLAYIFVIILEFIKLFSLVYTQKVNYGFSSLFDFAGYALLFVPVTLFILILNNEKEFYKFLTVIVFIKIFSLVSFYLYFFTLKTGIYNAIESSNPKIIFFFLIWPILLFCIDIFVLVFSILREKFLCKLFQ